MKWISQFIHFMDCFLFHNSTIKEKKNKRNSIQFNSISSSRAAGEEKWNWFDGLAAAWNALGPRLFVFFFLRRSWFIPFITFISLIKLLSAKTNCATLHSFFLHWFWLDWLGLACLLFGRSHWPQCRPITHPKDSKPQSNLHQFRKGPPSIKKSKLFFNYGGGSKAAANFFSSFSPLGRAEREEKKVLLMAGCIKSHPIHKLIPFHSSQLSSNSSCLSFMVEFISWDNF